MIVIRIRDEYMIGKHLSLILPTLLITKDVLDFRCGEDWMEREAVTRHRGMTVTHHHCVPECTTKPSGNQWQLSFFFLMCVFAPVCVCVCERVRVDDCLPVWGGGTACCFG